MSSESTQTSKTELPEMSAEEQQLQAMSMAMLQGYMQESGYDLKPTVTPKDPSLVTKLEAEIADLKSKPNAALPVYKTLISQKEQELNAAKADTKTEYEFARNELGEQIYEQNKKAVDYTSQLQDYVFNKTKDLFEGKMAISDDQKKYIEESMGAMREPVFKLFDAMKSEYENTGKSMLAAWDEVNKTIDETGLSFSAAINVIGERINDTEKGVLAGISEEEGKLNEMGSNVMAALQGVRDEINNTNGKAAEEIEKLWGIKQALNKQEKLDLYNDMKSRTAQMAATQGRSQFDPQFQAQLQDELMKNIGMDNLKMGEQEILMKLGLVKETGGKLEALSYNEAQQIKEQGLLAADIAAKKTALAGATGEKKEALAAELAQMEKEQGAKKEAVAGEKVGVAERTGAGAEGVAAAKAGYEQTIQGYGQGLKDQFAINQPLQLIGAGMDVSGYQSALKKEAQAGTAGAMGMAGAVAAPMQQERFAQPTTIQTTHQGGAGTYFGAVMGGLGAAAGAAGSVMGGYGALQGGSLLSKYLNPSTAGSSALGNYVMPTFDSTLKY